MFFRLALPGARRVLLDHIAFAREHVPRWNPLSVVGQHMQQAGATPAEAMGLTLSSAIQYAERLPRARLGPRPVPAALHLLLRHLDQLLRGGRQVSRRPPHLGRLTRERFGAKDPRSWRFKFHGQTSASISRASSRSTTSRASRRRPWPASSAACSRCTRTPTTRCCRCRPRRRRASPSSTQNILKEEAHLTDVIDPLGGSYYVEALTDQMEEKIRAVDRAHRRGRRHVRRGGGGAGAAHLRRLGAGVPGADRTGAQTIVGVNKYRVPAEEEMQRQALKPPPRKKIDAQLKRLKRFKAERDQGGCAARSMRWRAPPKARTENVFEKVVEAASAASRTARSAPTLRKVYGFGQPLIVP